MEPILQGRGLTKRYGKVTALDNCDFDLMPGEILAVIGDNGAGKSSLIKAISGAVIPDAGTVTLEGQDVRFASPIEAREAGIELAREQYRPHVTLARFGNGLVGPDVLELQAFISARMGRSSADFQMTGFNLYESRLGSSAGSTISARVRSPSPSTLAR